MPDQRRFSTGPDRTLWPPSGAVSGRSTLLSGLFRRWTPVSEDLCLLLDLDAGATLESVGPARSGTEFDEEGGRLWLGRLIR
jgi:hypothetical protein